MSAILEIDRIEKSFFGIHALKPVTFNVERGAVIGLIGENGAGKSTLMNIIGGVVSPSGGSMRFKGEPYSPRSAADAARAGIAFIHQELNLFGNLSVGENIFVDGYPKRYGLIDRAAITRRTREILGILSLDISPGTPVGTLSPGERQLVEIAKALHLDAELVIFDEPTTSLTPRETARLFEAIDLLRSQGKTIIYISHILADVARLSDTILVLRDGTLVATRQADRISIPDMISLMIGRNLEALFPSRLSVPGEEIVFRIRGISKAGILENVSLEVRRGEILGLFGLMGSGRTELARMIFGLDRVSRGEIEVDGQPIDLSSSVRSRIRSGLAFVTENRRSEGLFMEAPIADNVSIVSLGRYASGPLKLLDEERVSEVASRICQDLRIKAADADRQPVKSLSGGNQQKVVIGKWLLSSPKLLILDEPTRGVDVGAKYEIYSLVDRVAAEGNGILFISSEIEELMGMCDRIAVMSQGEITATFAKPFTDEAILKAAFREQAA
ncbi:sugar ABC transporter ATP-binding protein [Chelativorans sp.]|uniref:sugar ABC transporter ATP-binding protein n=1 Tax=Chelativorans sp. TaxID=2203393 RepID=UPI002810BDF2|nr:sugar ABC transporter ATP-binding protein [Chelativorans sp.]